jgi:hypothetical protein
MKLTTLLTIFALIFCSQAYAFKTMQFRPAPDVLVTLSLRDNILVFETEYNGNTGRDEVELEPTTDTPFHLSIDDYNADSYQDFSIWHLDEGNGVHTIHRVFLYQPQRATFRETFPECGDLFLNMQVMATEKGRFLRSTYFADWVPKQCDTNPR